ncbi:hypothetical protein FV232_00880 [Methylobacterium sp. WL30]|uniref:hypothetical protein n=1 Tax=unclassified Methylobacterium TaxID=2615210 RepID=UPI0011CBA4BF|nr:MULTISPECIES: hypothetical protein [unclassified Methylobacterium]TXN32548.1 hypothetical protein FV225_19690 [Methylobacterium sp. WL93]TXN52278.1 hypothetical protein FV227_04290 [Methylobacterium sp. WL119]TXN70639.1 hypothetical protein FV232_00880 [Methylobacterium sp. WL30]
MRRLILAAALIVALQPAEFARTAMETNQLVDDNGAPIGTPANPLNVTCKAGCTGGSGGSGGTVTQGPAATDTSANRWPVLAYQGGTWVLGAGSASIGSIANTAFGISGTLPAFAATPTFNLGTLNGAATAANQASEIAALGAPGDAANANTVIGQLKQANANLLVATPAAVTTAAPSYATGTTQALSLTTAGGLRVDGSGVTQPALLRPTADTASGITPAGASASTAYAVKSGSTNLYGYSITMSSTAGFLALLNSGSAPASGATIGPLECIPVAAAGYAVRRQDIPDRYPAGLTVVITSSCTTYTPVTPVVSTVLAQ